MRTEIVDSLNAGKTYEGIDLPPIPRFTLISTKWFAARRVNDCHIYLNDDGLLQVLIVGYGERER